MSVPSFFSKLLGFGKKVSIDFLHALVTFIKSPAVEQLLATALGQITQAVVAQFSGNAYATMTSDAKRQQAFDAISTQAKSAGIDFTDSAVNLLLETAVAKSKLQA